MHLRCTTTIGHYMLFVAITNTNYLLSVVLPNPNINNNNNNEREMNENNQKLILSSPDVWQAWQLMEFMASCMHPTRVLHLTGVRFEGK